MDIFFVNLSSCLLLFSFFPFIIFFLGIYFTSKKDSAFQETKWLGFLGIFVWGDAIIIGLFWTIASIVSIFVNNYYFCFLVISVFWCVRSFGEIIYWLNQQFSTLKRNPPERLFGFKIFKNESIWFAYQVFWQIVLCVSIIFSIYFAFFWLESMN